MGLLQRVLYISSQRSSSFLSNRLVLSKSVQQALNNKKGVVALESTVITHGLPYPNNLETALHLEEEVRLAGSEPATIALLDGKVHIGLTKDELQRVADTMDSVKVSRRDIPYTLVKKLVGGTTVAATMYLANLSGIKVFSTGGIGGVHRGADQTFDISADLQELSRTPVVVVCAGVKSILDISKTVEYLETHSVNTIVHGPRNVFPGFFTAQTTSKSQFSSECLNEIADVIGMSSEIGLDAGTVIACPIPKEFEADGELIEAAIQTALKEADNQKIQSQQITPFLLKRVNELTKGASMRTNIGLLRNNARIGGTLAKIIAEQAPRIVSKPESPSTSTNPSSKPKIAVIGATILDFEAITDQDVKDDGGSYPGIVTQRCGGVGRNHADALARLGCHTTLISVVGNDDHGKYLLDKCSHMDTTRIDMIHDLPTAVYTSMNVKGNVRFGISSIGDIVKRITPELIVRNEDVIANSKFTIMDGNIPVSTMQKIVEIANFHKVPVWYEPTDIFKARKIFDCSSDIKISAVSPNANEFLEWSKRKGIRLPENIVTQPKNLAEYLVNNDTLLEGLDLLLVSLSTYGSIVIKRNYNDILKSYLLPAPVTQSCEIISVSGAGDSLNSGIIAGLAHGLEFEKCLSLGQKCAALTLGTTEAVSKSIEYSLIQTC